MKRTLYLIVVFLTIAAIAGCVTAKKVVRERVDQDIVGNRGYIEGQAPEEPLIAKSRTREYIDIQIEVPTFEELGFGKKATKGASAIEKGVAPAEEPKPAKPAPAKEEKSKYIK